MIFVTVGNHYHGFNRLVQKADEIASHTSYDILIQKGYSSYRPKTARYFNFVPLEEAIGYIRASELVISHAGMGTILLCREYGIPMIIVPRRKKYGEHGTDHQVEIAKVLEQRKDTHLSIIYDEGHLEEKIREVLGRRDKRPSEINEGRTRLIQTIRTFIKNL